jgi:hypothetical protein
MLVEASEPSRSAYIEAWVNAIAKLIRGSNGEDTGEVVMP